MAKLGHRLKQRHSYSAGTQTGASVKPPSILGGSILEGDRLLAWLREHDPESVPTDEELASVQLIGTDCTSESIQWLYADLWRASVDEVRAYFTREAPESLLSDAGSRLNGLYRERAEAERRNLSAVTNIPG
jgi:hypothetical protein